MGSVKAKSPNIEGNCRNQIVGPSRVWSQGWVERVTLNSQWNLVMWRYVAGIKDSAKVFDGGRWRRIRLYLVWMKKTINLTCNGHWGSWLSTKKNPYRSNHRSGDERRKLHQIGNEGDERNNKNCEQMCKIWHNPPTWIRDSMDFIRYTKQHQRNNNGVAWMGD